MPIVSSLVKFLPKPSELPTSNCDLAYRIAVHAMPGEEYFLFTCEALRPRQTSEVISEISSGFSEYPNTGWVEAGRPLCFPSPTPKSFDTVVREVFLYEAHDLVDATLFYLHRRKLTTREAIANYNRQFEAAFVAP